MKIIDIQNFAIHLDVSLNEVNGWPFKNCNLKDFSKVLRVMSEI